MLSWITVLASTTSKEAGLAKITVELDTEIKALKQQATTHLFNFFHGP